MRAAVMGAGSWGSKLVRVLESLDGVELLWVVDPDPAACNRADAIAPGVGTTDSIEEVLDEIDVVAVATPARDHFEHTRYLLGQGKDVFSEKPLALRTYDAVTLDGLRQSEDAILMVGHQLLFHPVFRKLKTLVDSGVLGELRSVRAERTGPVDLEREPGVIWSYGPHDAAMILSLTGELPSSVSATGMLAPGLDETSQLADINLLFSSGVEASMHLSAIEQRRRRLTVTGELGTAVFDDTKPGGRLFLLDGRDVESQVEGLEKGEPLALELEHFIDCAANRRKPITGPEHAIKVTAILDEATERLTHTRNQRPFLIQAVYGVQ